jgi:hypothetical protein
VINEEITYFDLWLVTFYDLWMRQFVLRLLIQFTIIIVIKRLRAFHLGTRKVEKKFFIGAKSFLSLMNVPQTWGRGRGRENYKNNFSTLCKEWNVCVKLVYDYNFLYSSIWYVTIISNTFGFHFLFSSSPLPFPFVDAAPLD